MKKDELELDLLFEKSKRATELWVYGFVAGAIVTAITILAMSRSGLT